MKKSKYLYVEFILLVWFIFFTFINGNVQSLWADELSSIGFIRNGLSLKEMFHIYLYLDNNLPLYSAILYIWYRIVPYGEKFLLIPSILFCAGGIVFLELAVKRIKGERAGFLAFCLGCFSSTLIWQGAWEVRCYGLVFFLSAFTLWAYINRVLIESGKNLFIYGLAVLLFLWTHWFACILLVFYGIFDIVMIVRKKCSWKSLLCYPFGVVTYIPWVAVSLMNKRNELVNFWPEVPQWKNMVWTILGYVSGRRILWYVCLLTGAWICVKEIINLVNHHEEKSLIIDLGFINTLAIGWVIGSVFFYSRYVNPEGSLYVERYFMVIAPQILMITAWGIDSLIIATDRLVFRENMSFSRMKKGMAIAVRGVVLIGLCVYMVLCYRESYIAIRKPRQEFRQAADYLIQEGEIWSDNAAVIGSNRYCMLDGFVDFYFVKRGYPEPSNVIDGRVNSDEESRFYKNYEQWPKEKLLDFDIVYCIGIHMGHDDALSDFLSDNYIQCSDYGELGIEIWKRKIN